MIDKKVQEYWNSTARACNQNNKLIDNYKKRRLLISKLLEYNFEKKSILEIGPGLGLTGFITETLTPAMQYTGIDVSDQFAEKAKKLLKRNVIVGDAVQMPFGNEEFDILWAFDVLEHLKPEDREQTYKEINRVLKKTRSVFICNPLSYSMHDDGFDFGFSDKDITNLAEATNTRIYRTEILSVQEYYYQFIELSSIIYNDNLCKQYNS